MLFLMRTSCLAGFALAATLCSCRAAPDGVHHSQSSGSPPGARIEIEPGSEHLAKISSHLLQAWRLAEDGKASTEIAAAVPQIELTDGSTEVEVRLDHLTPKILERLRVAGFESQSHSLEHGLAYGRIRLQDLDDLAEVSEVEVISSRPRAGTRGPPAGSRV